MGMLEDKWLGGGADVAVRAAFSFAMCGALAGLLYLTAQDGLADGSSAQQTTPQAATVLASIDTKPKAAVEAIPAPVVVHANVPALVSASAEGHSTIPTRRPAAPVKPLVDKNAVARFDSCLPDCETRDPMIVGYAEKAPEMESPLQQDGEQIAQPVSAPILSGATSLLGKAFDMPGVAFRKGRSVITTVVRATL